MQHKSIITCATIALISILSIFATISCSNEESTPTPSSETQVLIEKAKAAGQLHNQLLSETLDNLKSSQSRSSQKLSIADIRQSGLNYLANKSCGNSSRSENVLQDNRQTILDLTNKEIPAMRQEMIEKERILVDKGIYCIEREQPQMIENLLVEAANSELPDDHKEAVMNFLATLQASEIYWEENNEDWREFLRENLSAEDYDIFKLDDPNVPYAHIVFADAYYMWWGTLGSGCNFGIGICCGAVGSFCAYLNS